MKEEKLTIQITWNKDKSLSIIPSSEKAMEKYIGLISKSAFRLLDDFMKDMHKKAIKLKKWQKLKKQ